MKGESYCFLSSPSRVSWIGETPPSVATCHSALSSLSPSGWLGNGPPKRVRTGQPYCFTSAFARASKPESAKQVGDDAPNAGTSRRAGRGNRARKSLATNSKPTRQPRSQDGGQRTGDTEAVRNRNGHDSSDVTDAEIPSKRARTRLQRPQPRDDLSQAIQARKSGDLAECRSLLGIRDASEIEETPILNEYLALRTAEMRARHPPAPPTAILDELLQIVRQSSAQPSTRTFNGLLAALRTDEKAMASICVARADKLVDQMRASGTMSDSFTLSMLFQMAGNATDLEALDKFSKLPGTSLDVVSGTALIAAYAKCGSVENAERVFGLLLNSGVKVNERTYTTIISAYQRAGMHTKTLNTLDAALRSSDVRLSVFLFSSALRSCARQADAPNARKYFMKMEEAGVQPTSDSFNAVLDAAVRGADLSLALDVLFNWMRKRNHFPERDQVNSVIALAGRVGLSGGGGKKVVLRIMKKMATELKVDPDLGTFNAVIAALGRSKDMVTAQFVMDFEMRLFKVTPNVTTYNALINACAEVSRPYVAFEQLHEMKRAHGLMPNQISYNSVLHQCAKAKEVKLVDAVLRAMEAHPGIRLDSVSVTILLQMYRSLRDLNGALAIFRRAVAAQNTRKALDVAAYNALIRMCFEDGKRDIAVGLVGTLFVNRRANPTTYNVLIEHAGAKEQNPERALFLFQDMKDRALAPSHVTYATIIKVCAHNGRLDRAFRLLAEMQDVGLGSRDTYAWTDLIDACGRAGQSQRAVELFDFMRTGGREGRCSGGVGDRRLIPEPNVAAYNAAIYAGGLRGGTPKQAVRIYNQMQDDRNVQPDVITYSALASVLLNRKLKVTDLPEREFIEHVAENLLALIKGRSQDPSESPHLVGKDLKRLRDKHTRLRWVMKQVVPKGEKDSDGGGDK